MSKLPSVDEAPDNKMASITRKVLQWVILGLVVFTCAMAAIRKFG
jgi:hypothetical protein